MDAFRIASNRDGNSLVLERTARPDYYRAELSCGSMEASTEYYDHDGVQSLAEYFGELPPHPPQPDAADPVDGDVRDSAGSSPARAVTSNLSRRWNLRRPRPPAASAWRTVRRAVGRSTSETPSTRPGQPRGFTNRVAAFGGIEQRQTVDRRDRGSGKARRH
jgi:hypothetical protein